MVIVYITCNAVTVKVLNWDHQVSRVPTMIGKRGKCLPIFESGKKSGDFGLTAKVREFCQSRKVGTMVRLYF